MALGYYEFLTTQADNGISVKGFLRRRCGLTARSMTVIKYNGGSIRRGDEALRAHDILHPRELISVELPREHCDIEPVEGRLDILYEDDYLLVINKPPGMPVHPTKVHQLDTLANLVSAYQRRRGESYTFRAMNRLDKDTSGCVLIAKDRIAYAAVLGTVGKTYIAVCEGMIEQAGTVDRPIALSPDSRMRRCMDDNGAPSVTHYRPIGTGAGHTLCEVRPETGRTHQIRCHMSGIGHPLAGDDMYGGSLAYIGRQALHCRTVTLVHPITQRTVKLTAPVPDDMEALFGKVLI